MTEKDSLQIESYKKTVNSDVHDTLKIKALQRWGQTEYHYNPDKELELIKQAEDICRKNLAKKLNKDEILYFKTALIDSKFHRAQNIDDRGQYDKARQLYFECIKSYQSLNLLKEEASALNSLGTLHQFQGYLDSALFYFEKSLLIKSEVKNMVGVANTLNNMAMVYQRKGNFAIAFNYFDRSYHIRDSLGLQRESSTSLNNIGILYFRQGNMNRALEHFKMSLKVMEELGDKRGISRGYNNLGGIYFYKNEFDSSLMYYQKSIEVKKELGSKREIASTLGNMASINLKLGRYDVALKEYEEAMEISVEIGNKSHISNMLCNMGSVFSLTGNYQKALEYNRRSLDISTQTGETERIRKGTIGMILNYWKVDSVVEAYEYTHNISSGRKRDIDINIPILTSEEKEMYFKAALETDYNMLFDYSEKNSHLVSGLAGDAYNHSLLIKGLLLKSASATRQSIMDSGDTTLIGEYQEWISLKQDIAKQYSRGKDVSELEETARKMEKQLSTESVEFRDNRSAFNIEWTAVQNSLEPNEAAIEFIHYRRQADPIHYLEDIETARPETYYAAIVIRPDWKEPKIVGLFEEKKITKIIGRFPGNNAEYIEQTYGKNSELNTELYELIWKPIDSLLEDAETVHISPSGILHKISFPAIAYSKRDLLCDKYELELKASTALIASSNRLTHNADRSFVLYGGIQYGTDSSTTQVWNYLQGSFEETTQIEKILTKKQFSVEHFSQSNATEEQFKLSAGKSQVLHIATHGFFYPDPDKVIDDYVDEEESEEPINFRGGSAGVGVNTFVKSKNPLMRSGLALARANYVWSRTDIEGEDGVLTAAEVATIDMRNTDLVVLSACETGLGDIKGSEGVYGLQRSFKMAGVKYLVMSLWQVPDKETAEFMTSFYKNLTKTNDIKKSFSMTQSEMRKKYDPYYWAAFVLVE